MRIVLLKFEDVSQICPAPRIDRLIIIAHYHDVLVTSSEKLSYQVLRMIRILILVDHHVLETLLIRAKNIGLVLKEKKSMQEQIVEIHGIGLTKALLVADIDLRHALSYRVDHARFEIQRNNEFVFRL